MSMEGVFGVGKKWNYKMRKDREAREKASSDYYLAKALVELYRK